MHLSRRLAVVIIVVAALGPAGCASSDAPTASSPRSQAVTVVEAVDALPLIETRTVIDVRSPTEFAAGHLVGAVNIDVQASDFGARVESLDRDAPYLVYCQSGRRSAMAAALMAEAGFTDVVDAGGFADLVKAGAPSE